MSIQVRVTRALTCGMWVALVDLERKLRDEQWWTPIFVPEVVARVPQDYSLVIVDQRGGSFIDEEEG